MFSAFPSAERYLVTAGQSYFDVTEEVRWHQNELMPHRGLRPIHIRRNCDKPKYFLSIRTLLLKDLPSFRTQKVLIQVNVSSDICTTDNIITYNILFPGRVSGYTRTVRMF